MGATPGANKERKARLVKDGDVNCAYCPYHRVENRRGYFRRTDKHKNHRTKGTHSRS